MATGDQNTPNLAATPQPATADQNNGLPKPVVRKIVICLDGTGNQIGASRPTNVAKVFEMLDLTEPALQIGYYDPGVGTLPSSTARGTIGRFLSKVTQLAFGFGMRTNVAEAYTWLMQHYQPNDEIYVFGFSRGAYTARALVGMLTRPGLLRPGSENLVEYAVGEYATNRKITPGVQNGIREFADAFCWGTAENPLFREWQNPKYHEDWHCIPIKYLGLWDTVKASGFLIFWKAMWPYTKQLFNVERVRHAVSIDEHRRPYHEDLILPHHGVEEVWFTGVHSDVGGTFDDDDLRPKFRWASFRRPDQLSKHRPVLSTIPLKWIVDGLEGQLIFRPKAYHKSCIVSEGNALGKIHNMGWLWNLLGWQYRNLPDTVALHASVEVRREKLGYLPAIPQDATFVDPGWEKPSLKAEGAPLVPVSPAPAIAATQ